MEDHNYIKFTVDLFSQFGDVADALWQIRTKSESVSLHECFVFLRFGDIDPETGIEIKQSFTETFKDIYPIHILENLDGIQGSCAFFKQRTNVTKHIRSKSFTPLMNLQEAQERFGELELFQYHQITAF